MKRKFAAHAGALAFVLAAASSCTSPKRPTEADLSRYMSGEVPSYFAIGKASAAYTAVTTAGNSKLPAGSWKIDLDLTLRAGEDLYASTPAARTLRDDFQRAVMKAEQMRVDRIAKVETLAKNLGLIKEGAPGPMPAFPVAIATKAGDEVHDRVPILATPDGNGWKFVQQGPQSLGSEAGEPLALLRQENPTLTLVAQGSDEDRDFQARQTQFLRGLSALN